MKIKASKALFDKAGVNFFTTETFCPYTKAACECPELRAVKMCHVCDMAEDQESRKYAIIKRKDKENQSERQ